MQHHYDKTIAPSSYTRYATCGNINIVSGNAKPNTCNRGNNRRSLEEKMAEATISLIHFIAFVNLEAKMSSHCIFDISPFYTFFVQIVFFVWFQEINNIFETCKYEVVLSFVVVSRL